MVRQAAILVGGLGTRLGDLTRTLPKPLLEVGGRPFLLWLIDELRRHGIEDVLLLAGHKAEHVEALAAEAAPEARVIREPEPMGTGGALRFAEAMLDDRFFLLNGDSLFDVNLWDLALAHRGGVEAAMALRPVADAARYGSVVLEGERVVRFSERPDAGGGGLVNGGVGLLSRAVVARIEPGRAVSIEREIYPVLAAAGRLAGKVYHGPFIDIGVPEDFARAQTYVPEALRRGAVIFDRDGVLNEDVRYAHRAEQIVWVEGAAEAVKRVNDAGLFAFVATNQAGVAHGYYGEAEIHALHRWMNAELRARGAHVDAFVHSPYHPEGAVEAYRRDADCRKPKPGMIMDLLARFPVDATRTLMIGDKLSDVAAAEAAGVPGVLFEGGSLDEALKPLLPALIASGV